MDLIRPMLATEAPARRLQALVEDDTYRLECKLDGHRVMLHIEGGRAKAVGRNGQASQHDGLFRTRPFADALAPVTMAIVLDGELIDGTLHVFDMPFAAYPLDILPAHGLDVRREALEQLFSLWRPDTKLFRLVHSASTTEEKARLAADCVEKQVEGVMAKVRHAPYRAGARSTQVIKVKFTKDADLIVTSLGFGGRDNCTLSCYRDGQLVEVGRASTVGARRSPEVGEVWTVRYIYLGAGDRIVQPRLVCKRTDKDPAECDFAQLVRANKEVIA